MYRRNFAILSYIIDNVIADDVTHLVRNINHIGGKVDEQNIIHMIYDEEKVKEHLIRLSNKNEVNVIIVIGDTTNTEDINSVTYKVITEVIDDNELSNELDLLISNLTDKLTISFTSAICGIRKRTLIINLCGPYITAIIFLKANREMILEIIDLMHTQEVICNNNNSNNNNDDNNVKDNNDNNNVKDNNDDNNVKDNNLSLRSLLKKKPEEKIKEISTTVTETHKRRTSKARIPVESAIDVIRYTITENAGNIHDESEIVMINEAYGRILSDDAYSLEDVPNCRTSTKHGYAVLASDGQGVRKVLTTDAVFSENFSLISGTCVRVKSGTPIPKGATAVVKLENTKITEKYDNNDYFCDDKEYEIDILITPEKNANIRDIGCEIKCNQHILERFTRIGPAELNILALCGFNVLAVMKVPSVGLLSIGDELEEIGNPLNVGCIYDSNRITLISLLKENDFDPVDFGISINKSDTIIAKLIDALEKVDVVVTMGCSNDKDKLKLILQQHFNVTIYFDNVIMKPGKSTIFATCMFNKRRKYFLCMSANPATVPVVAHVLLLPLMNELHHNYYAKSINIQTCIRNSQHELHSRPKFSWTTLQWTESETFPRAYSKNQHQNIMQYQKANALLKLPPRTPQVAMLDAAFVPAIFSSLKYSCEF